MPELPEVETTTQGIKPHLEGQVIARVVVYNTQFRIPVSKHLNDLCTGKQINKVIRRAKYILLELSKGYLLIHLGMSGHLRMTPDAAHLEKHEHIILILTNGRVLRFCDPRRFGLFLYLDENPSQHKLLSHLGPEPLSEEFNGDYLVQKTRNKNKPIKSFIMDNNTLVGIGNIYATESLFMAKIHPNTLAKSLSEIQCFTLAACIKKVLKQAIECGGTTLKDFYAFDGKPGYFNLSLQAYGRKNQPCLRCNYLIDSIFIGGRNSFYCPNCQQN